MKHGWLEIRRNYNEEMASAITNLNADSEKFMDEIILKIFQNISIFQFIQILKRQVYKKYY